MITDEMVEKAILILVHSDKPMIECVRAALEVVEPMLIANSLNALGEAYEEVARVRSENRVLRNYAVVAEERMETLTDELAKRQELDPQ